MEERKQRVHTLTCVGAPLTIVLTLFKFGLNVRLERLCECDIFIPKRKDFSQKKHFAILFSSYFNYYNYKTRVILAHP